jgi:hypothetical protein
MRYRGAAAHRLPRAKVDKRLVLFDGGDLRSPTDPPRSAPEAHFVLTDNPEERDHLWPRCDVSFEGCPMRVLPGLACAALILMQRTVMLLLRELTW